MGERPYRSLFSASQASQLRMDVTENASYGKTASWGCRSSPVGIIPHAEALFLAVETSFCCPLFHVELPNSRGAHRKDGITEAEKGWRCPPPPPEREGMHESLA